MSNVARRSTYLLFHKNIISFNFNLYRSRLFYQTKNLFKTFMPRHIHGETLLPYRRIFKKYIHIIPTGQLVQNIFQTFILKKEISLFPGNIRSDIHLSYHHFTMLPFYSLFAWFQYDFCPFIPNQNTPVHQCRCRR